MLSMLPTSPLLHLKGGTLKVCRSTARRMQDTCKALLLFAYLLLLRHGHGGERHGRTHPPSENVPENDPIENSRVPAYATPRFPEKAEPALNHHSVSSTPSAGQSYGKRGAIGRVCIAVAGKRGKGQRSGTGRMCIAATVTVSYDQGQRGSPVRPLT